jgi:DNA-nicking Smr family endonuclease
VSKKQGFNNPFAGLDKLVPVEPPAKLGVKPQRPAAAPEPALSDDELFAREMTGTAPLVDRERAPGEKEPPRLRPGDDAEVLAQLSDLCSGDGSFDVADSDEYIEGLAAGCDRRLLRRLRAGEYAVQAHVDLHGLLRDEARERVARFIADCRREGRRCVLIVHGRGLHSKDQIPVLKGALKTWLERGSTGRAVLAFATARPCDGGAGAVYVLLRK